MSADIQAYVHVTAHRDDGFVEFNFALGDPSMYIEMILPQQAFMEFCANNRAIALTSDQVEFVEKEEMKWRYGTTEASALVE